MSIGRIPLPTLEQVQQIGQALAINQIDTICLIDLAEAVWLSRGPACSQPESHIFFVGNGRNIFVQKCERYVPILVHHKSARIFYGRHGDSGFQVLRSGDLPAIFVELDKTQACRICIYQRVEPLFVPEEPLDVAFFRDLLLAELSRPTDVPHVRR